MVNNCTNINMESEVQDQTWDRHKQDELWANAHLWYPCKQEVGMWRVQKRFPRYGVPIWSLWPNIRFLSSIVAEKNVMKNILGRTEGQTDGRMDRGKTVYPPLWWSGDIKMWWIKSVMHPNPPLLIIESPTTIQI